MEYFGLGANNQEVPMPQGPNSFGAVGEGTWTQQNCPGRFVGGVFSNQCFDENNQELDPITRGPKQQSSGYFGTGYSQQMGMQGQGQGMQGQGQGMQGQGMGMQGHGMGMQGQGKGMQGQGKGMQGQGQGFQGQGNNILPVLAVQIPRLQIAFQQNNTPEIERILDKICARRMGATSFGAYQGPKTYRPQGNYDYSNQKPMMQGPSSAFNSVRPRDRQFGTSYETNFGGAYRSQGRSRARSQRRSQSGGKKHRRTKCGGKRHKKC